MFISVLRFELNDVVIIKKINKFFKKIDYLIGSGLDNRIDKKLGEYRYLAHTVILIIIVMEMLYLFYN